MEKGNIITITIEDITNDGSGIGKYEGMAVFTKGAALGDTVRVRITKLKKSYAIGALEEITELSPYRQNSDCRYFEKGCGGCTFRNISYEAELGLKEKQVKDKLERLAGIKNPPFEGIIGQEDFIRYRNKAQFPVGIDGRTGFYRIKTHEVVSADDCLLQSRAAVAAAGALERFIKEDHITVYDERKDKGLMKHLIVKTSESTGEVMVILVINGKGIPNAEKLAGMLDDAVYEAGYDLESIAININKGKSNRITSDDYVVIAGKPVIASTCMGLNFEISPSAFYQVNTVQTEKLYGKALEYADLKGGEMIYDLYCGVGTIGLIAADRLARIGKGGYVYGIESVKGAVIDANRNAVINGIVNAEFVCGLAEEKTEGLLEKGRPDVVFLDPPRSGCDEKLISLLKEIHPEKIVYVSCDPATMARDLKSLNDKYILEKCTAVDMFPRCNNVETVLKLVKK